MLNPKTPSPERLGLRGTAEWWFVTVKTAATLVVAAGALALSPFLIDGVDAKTPSDDKVQEQPSCYREDQLRTMIVIQGRMAVRELRITEADLCMGTTEDDVDAIDPHLLVKS